MEDKVHDEETERFLLLLRREVQRAAERLVKVRPHDALKYANRQAEYMDENDRKEEQVYWEKIAIEVEKILNFKS
ncbi:MAG: hypothetical protein HN377_11735 [Alphaproteobacteria bacterium]|jgi:hypothetical protein|nr:hypothetical protein [Alphaproteobacteria bacterium]MBT7944174.1 hypothetical protein [Alphaproteobacteria bacterium]